MKTKKIIQNWSKTFGNHKSIIHQKINSGMYQRLLKMASNFSLSICNVKIKNGNMSFHVLFQYFTRVKIRYTLKTNAIHCTIDINVYTLNKRLIQQQNVEPGLK